MAKVFSQKVSIPEVDPEQCRELSAALRAPEEFARVLLNRGISTADAAGRFLNPVLEDLHDPFLFTQMRGAVSAVKRAIQKQEHILVYGDYDVDGVTSLAVMMSALRSCGAKCSHFIPHRLRDGYGLNKNIVSIAKERGAGMVITVDCGTGSPEPVQALRDAGIGVVITDHHEPSGKNAGLAAQAVINPKVPDSGYPFRDLAGVGVAYKFCQALLGGDMHDLLDIVALGTIADSVPLLGENRIIAGEGLKRILSTRRVGLKSLLESSRLKKRSPNAELVSFILGPRLNAGGRIDSAETAFQLLISDNEAQAKELAAELESLNRQRQRIESAMFEEARELISTDPGHKDRTVLVVAKEGWHLGVIGIVASKLAEQFYRPVIMISKNGGVCRGSGRSIKDFHLFESLCACGDLLDNFGGHQHAVGMSIQQENISEFRDRINRFAGKNVPVDNFIPSVEADAMIPLSAISEQLLRLLERMSPFGEGNPKPYFYTSGLRLKGGLRILSRDTLKFWVTDGTTTFQAIGFGLGGMAGDLSAAGSFGMVYHPRIDSWLGQESVILEIEEILLK
jgi:single-stranded-DNA-specific exonuclease